MGLIRLLKMERRTICKFLSRLSLKLIIGLTAANHFVAASDRPIAAFTANCRLGRYVLSRERHLQSIHRRNQHCMSTQDQNSNQKSAGDSGKVNLFSKAAWVSAELLGNVARTLRGSDDSDEQKQAISTETISKDEALDRLRKEYERSYFISGEMDIDLYSEDCLFAGS